MGERPGTSQRDGSFWVVAAGLAAVVVVGLLTGARTGSFVLAGVLVVAAIVRGVRPAPGPAALAVRRRWLDVTVLGVLALALAVLAAIVPAAA